MFKKLRLLFLKQWMLTFIAISFIYLTCQVKKDVFYSFQKSVLEIPYVVKIDDGLYIQQYELSYKEYAIYQQWVDNVYGYGSKQSKFTDLDLDCLSRWQGCVDESRILDYLYDQNLPLICVTATQVQAFAKWYSDRSFENMLLRRRIIDKERFSNSKILFTIEHYFNDSLDYIVKHEKLKFYPRFRLPTIDEWKKAYYFSRLLDGKYFRDCKSDFCNFCRDVSDAFWVEIDPCRKDLENKPPLMPVMSGCHAKNDNAIFHLKGNVREISANPGYSLGASWSDSREVALKVDVFPYDGPNTITGARFVFEWVQW